MYIVGPLRHYLTQLKLLRKMVPDMVSELRFASHEFESSGLHMLPFVFLACLFTCEWGSHVTGSVGDFDILHYWPTT